MTLDAKALPGHFYLIGVGPGAPDLLTLRAASIVRSCDVLIAPRAESAAHSLALRSVASLVDAQEVVEHVYPMERDLERTRACWATIAADIAARCERGQSVAHLTIGDPLIYSTAIYLQEQIAALLAPDRIHVVAGLSAFQAASALLSTPLTLQEDRMMLMSAADLDAVADALHHCETLVLYKVGPRAQALAQLLAAHGLVDRAHMVCYAEQGERQRIVAMRDLVDAPLEERAGYMSTVIVHIGRRNWSAS